MADMVKHENVGGGRQSHLTDEICIEKSESGL